MRPVDTDKVREKQEFIIAQNPEFQDDMDSWDEDEEEEKSEKRKEAQRRKKNLALVYLMRDCARDPDSANGLHTLDGMAQESCILNIR